MTIPAVLGLSFAAFIVVFGLLLLGISRGPGWRAYRWVAYAALAAATYLVCDVPVTVAVEDFEIIWSSRLTLACGGVFGACWYPYLAETERRSLSRSDRWVIAVALATAALALIPGLVVSDRVTSMRVGWFGASYRDAEPTAIGAVCYMEYCVLLCALVIRLLSSARAGNRAARVEALGNAILLATAVSDALSAARVWDMPYLIGFGFLAVVVAVGCVGVSRVIVHARALEASSRELREAQDRLVQSERLAALGELSAVIAHEVRNPLGVIYNAVSQLRRPRAGEGEGEGPPASLLGILQEEAERLNRMVGLLLEFARPSPPRFTSLSVERVLRSAAQAVMAAAAVRSDQLEVEIEPGLSEISGDEHMLRQALINLLENALTAPGRRSPVSVKARRDPGSAWVLVTVVDDGAGIPSGMEEKIFTPFFTTRAQGTGLGLAIVRRIAEAHGGSVRVGCSGGHGAKFVLALPMDPQAVRAA